MASLLTVPALALSNPTSGAASSGALPRASAFRYWALRRRGWGVVAAVASPNSVLSEHAFKRLQLGSDDEDEEEYGSEGEGEEGGEPGMALDGDKEELAIARLGLPDELVATLEKRGITHLFPIQRAVLIPAFEGRDLIARAKTGTGKTLAFGIPMIKQLIEEGDGQSMRRGRTPRVLVLAPTRELAKQVEKEIKESAPKLGTVCVYGGVSYNLQQNALSRGVDVVVGTPGRIIDLINGGSLQLGEVRYLVLDEADQMLAVGFEEDVETILQQLPAERQSMLFSATMPSWVKKLSRRYLNNPLTIDLVGDQDEKLAEGIKLYAIPLTGTSKRTVLSDLITVYAKGGKTIVFTKTKRDADEVSLALSNSIASEALHGDISQHQRERTLNGFRQGKFTVLVATDVAARGLDIPNVDLVIHYELPNDPETFVHRSGRTGRAGKEGTAILMHTSSQKRTVRSLERDVGCKFEFISPPSMEEVLESSAEHVIATLRRRRRWEPGPGAPNSYQTLNQKLPPKKSAKTQKKNQIQMAAQGQSAAAAAGSASEGGSPASGAAAAAASAFPATSLYVGDLHESVQDAQLFDVFSQVGAVVSVRVCRDINSRKSLGYAYVNYNNPADAARALELLNFTPINGKPIRIMYSNRDPSSRKSGAANIFIKNLDKSIDNKALYDTFCVFGNILSCKIATDPSGESRGYGFVQFERDESAQAAIDKLNGMLINDKKVYVGPFVRKQDRENVSSNVKFSNVYVKNLSETVTDDELKEMFGKYGTITSAVVMRDSDGKSRCFGFVNFESADDAAVAVQELNGKVINEKELYVGRAQKKSEREMELKEKFEKNLQEVADKYQNTNLYLKNLEDTVDDDKLRELFAEYGTITSCKVMRDSNGVSRGSGFVAFKSGEDASRALAEMNGKMVGSKPLYVALAQRKEDRKAKLQAQFSQMRPVAMAPSVGPRMPMFPPGVPGVGQQLFYGQPPPAFINPQAGFGFQQPLMPGMRPGAPMPNFIMPMVQQGQQPQRPAGRRAGGMQQPMPMGGQQQMFPRGGRGYRYPTGRGMPDPGMHGVGGVMPSPYEMGGGMPLRDAGVSQPVPIGALATALANAPPEQQRLMLGENLYPLVDQLEHEQAAKVTGMLLEMDQTEVLHLLESPDALKAKVAEAMEVLRSAQHLQQTNASPEQQLANLSLNDGVISS